MWERNTVVTQRKHTLVLGHCCVVGHFVGGKRSSDSEEAHPTLFVVVTLTKHTVQ
jgi:hypothetical protein